MGCPGIASIVRAAAASVRQDAEPGAAADGGAILVSGTSSSLRPPPLQSGVDRRRYWLRTFDSNERYRLPEEGGTYPPQLRCTHGVTVLPSLYYGPGSRPSR